jgi:hypothetical protein
VLGRESSFRENVSHSGNEVPASELYRGDIDGHGQKGPFFTPPSTCLQTCFAEYPSPDRDDQPAPLCGFNELKRKD